MQKKEFDDFPKCRVCKKELSEEEKNYNLTSKKPALCREHVPWLDEQIKKCAPLFSKMKF